jgi:nucleoid-associated protein
MTTGMTLNKALEFNESQRLDLEHLHLAARINLTEWQKGKQLRYLAFKLGAKTQDMREYFSDFIGCKEFTAYKADTKMVVKVITDYANELNYDFDKATRANELANEYCRECKKNGEKVNLVHLAKHVFPEKPEGLLTIAQNDPYCLNSEIGIDLRALSGFTRYKGQNKKFTLSFAREELHKSIIFDGEKSLTINELPEDFISQLKGN